LIADDIYESGHMAFERAKSRLAGLTPVEGGENGNESELEGLDREITSIQAILRKSDPSVRERVVDRVSSWMETVGT